MKKIILILLIACMCLSALSGCGENKTSKNKDESNITSEKEEKLTTGPATILPRLEKAYNSQDLYAIVECFDPSITKAFFGVAKLFGVQADAIQSILPFASEAFGAAGVFDNESWGKVKLTAISQDADEYSGTLTYNVNLTYSDGSKNDFEETVDVVSVDGIWYFAATQSANLSSLTGNTTVTPKPIPVTAGIEEKDVADGLFKITKNEKYGFINNSGKVIIDLFFAYAGDFTGDYCSVRYKENNFDKFGIINKYGKLVVDYTFEDISNTSADGFWAVKHNGKWGFLNIDTMETVDFKYDDCKYSAEGFWAVCEGHSWGFLNPKTKQEIPCQYTEYGIFNSRATRVKKGGYWGAVDSNNKTVVQFIYDKMTDFENGISLVELNRGKGAIKENGSYAIPLSKLEWIRNNGKFLIAWDYYAKSHEQHKIYNTDGKYLMSCKEYCGLIGENASLEIGKENISDSTNVITIDNTGAVKLNILNDYFPSLQAKYGEEILIFYNNGYITVKAGGHSSNKTIVQNYMTADGKFLNEEWSRKARKSIISNNDKYICVYDNITNKTIVYDKGWVQIATLDGMHKFYSSKLNDNILFNSDNGKYYSILNGEYLDYENVTCNSRDDAAIVYNGFLFGLYYKGKLLGSGLNYNEIKYDADMEWYELKFGATTEYIRIGRDGTVNTLE